MIRTIIGGCIAIAGISGLTAIADKDGLPFAIFCSLFTAFFLFLGGRRLSRLDAVSDDSRRYCIINYAAAALHFASATALAWLAFHNENEWEAPATTTSVVWYRTGDSDSRCSPSEPCFIDFVLKTLPSNIPVATLAVLFGLISGGGHIIACLLTDSDLEDFTSSVLSGRNVLRWADYSLSSSIMIIVIAAVTGVSEVRNTFLTFLLIIVSHCYVNRCTSLSQSPFFNSSSWL